MLKKLKERVLNNKVNQITFGVILAIGAFSILSALMSKAENKAPSSSSSQNFTPDTIIPAGYVLIPIELMNSRSLDGIIGEYGIVDLYTAPILEGEKSKKVGDNIKIIRSPYDPSQFAVLILESESELIVKNTGQFTAVIQNPNSKDQSALVKETLSTQKRIAIEYFQ